MNNNKVDVTNWLSYAEVDLDNCLYMFKGHRYGASIYFAHQSLEKVLKTYIIFKFDIYPRKTHDLLRLLVDTKLDYNLNLDTLKELSNAYLIIKYPDIVGAKYSKKENSEHLIKFTIEFFKWIKEKLEQN